MNKKEYKHKKDYKLRAQIAKALAHPSRMLILDALLKREMCVCELTELVDSDQSTVSKHLAVLKNAGLIEDRKEGMKVFYRILCPCIQNFFDCLEKVAQTRMKKYSEMCETALGGVNQCMYNEFAAFWLGY